MCLSEIGLVVVLFLTLLSAKYSRISRYVPHMMAFCVLLIPVDSEAHWNCNWFVYSPKYSVIKFCIMSAGAVLLYMNNIVKQQVIIILSTIGGILLLSSCNILSMILAMEVMFFSSYFWAYDSQKYSFQDANYFKYNMLASMFLLFSASILYKFFSVSSFEDIRFVLSFENGQNRFLLLVVLTLIAAFSIRIGTFRICFEKIPLRNSALIFCVLIPVSSLKINALMSEVFCAVDVNGFLRIVGCFTILYAGVWFYNTQKISELLTSLIVYNAGIVHICCATYSSAGLLFLCVSEILTVLGVVSLLAAVRKRFNGELVYVPDLFSFGFRHKKMGVALSCLFLCIMSFPTSLNFLGKFHVCLSMIKCGYFVDLSVFIISSILVIIRCVQTISKIWSADNSVFFSVVNIKLTNMVYVIIIMDMIAFPLGYALSKVFGGYYVVL